MARAADTLSISSACTVCEIHAESIFRIEGMDCHEEVTILERRLRPLKGLEGLTADVVGQRLRVRYDAAHLSASAIVDAVAQTGMRAWLEQEEPVALPAETGLRRLALVVASGVALAAGFTARIAGAPDTLTWPLFLLAVIAGGLFSLRRALVAVRLRVLDINVLMVCAVAGAMVLGEWSEAGTVIFLFALAQQLEARAMDRARGAIRALMDLTPLEALVRRNGEDVRVGVDDLRVGDRLVVRPGQKIPLDGRVTAGQSVVNQAPVTGESLPADKDVGDEVFAGTVNGRGALEVEVTRLRRDTTLARIIHLVETAQAERAPSQSFVDRFARVYTPVVLLLAVAVAVLPPLALGQPAGVWFYRALVLLVISCPCALVISTPVSIVSALAGAARRGVLIKGGVHLERASQIRCVAFDKTGTLTRGEPRVVEVVSLGGIDRDTVLGVAAALEARSEHPVGQAILRGATDRGLTPTPATALQALPGLGAEARVDGRPALVGNHRLFEARGLCSPSIDARLDGLSAGGRTVVLVAWGGETIGLIGVADELRETSADVVTLLREHGIAHVAMLTGDNTATASTIGRAAGVADVRSELLPEDKVAAVRDLRAAHGPVAMVGDGVNDAPALAAADVGIAMGVGGTAAALETADIALMADDLLRIPYALRLSRATVRTIKVNIAFSLILKAAFLGLAVAGMATLWMAVLADMGASLLVIANGMRLLATR